MTKLIKAIGPETSAILWITNESFEEQKNSELFFELDYLFDGLLSKYCQSSKVNDGKAFFSTPSFDKTLFLGLVCFKNSNFNNEFSDILDIMNQQNSENKFIIRIISDTHIDNNLIKRNKQKHQNINFFTFSN